MPMTLRQTMEQRWDLYLSCRGWMISQLREEPERYLESNGQTVMVWGLVQACAEAFGHQEWVNDEEHQVWHAAEEAADRCGYGVR